MAPGPGLAHSRAVKNVARFHRPDRLALLVLVALATLGCVDGPSFLNVDNQTDATYVAQVLDDEFRVIPPKTKVTVARIWFAGDPKFEVRFFDVNCLEVGSMSRGQGLVTISATGIVTEPYSSKDRGALTMAEESRFCAPRVSTTPSIDPTGTP
jgi:hypothetical protein